MQRQTGKKRILYTSMLLLCCFAVLWLQACGSRASNRRSGVDVYTPRMLADAAGIEVRKAEITYTVEDFPTPLSKTVTQPYAAHAEAAYTLYNSGETDICAPFVLPLGYLYSTVYNGKYDFAPDYNKIAVNGEEISKTLRHGYSDELYRGVSVDTLYPDIGVDDEYRKDTYFLPELPVTAYTCSFDWVDFAKYRRAKAYCTVRKEDTGRIFIPGRDGRNYLKNGTEQWHRKISKDDFEVTYYVVGEPLAYPLRWVAYEDGDEAQKRVLGEAEAVTTATTFEQLAFMYFDPQSGISSVDWYNAVVQRLNGVHERAEKHWSMLNVTEDLSCCYAFSVTIPALSTAVLSVTVPVYPDIYDDVKPYEYSYSFKLYPDDLFKSVGEIDVHIRTPFHATAHPTENFVAVDGGYTMHFTELPQNEIHFMLCMSQNPKKKSDGKLTRDIWIIVAVLYIAAALPGILLYIFLRKRYAELRSFWVFIAVLVISAMFGSLPVIVIFIILCKINPASPTRPKTCLWNRKKRK